MEKIILVPGAIGNLGERIIKALLSKSAKIHVVVRKSSNVERTQSLERLGVKVFRVDMSNVNEVAKACIGASCVVSALAGLRDVIIDAQKILLDAAILAKVPRFIPSDFSLDFTRLTIGENRNLDLRREFHKYLDTSSISATTIFVGPFMDLLTGQMLMILFKMKRVLYWGNKDQRIDFTTMNDTAEFTANMAVDSSSPRFLKVAGEQISPVEMTKVVSEVEAHQFRLLRAGSVGLLRFLIGVTKILVPGKKELYPAWQGMQYMRDMVEGNAQADCFDNNRYPGMKWTTVKEMLLLHR